MIYIAVRKSSIDEKDAECLGVGKNDISSGGRGEKNKNGGGGILVREDLMQNVLEVRRKNF